MERSILIFTATLLMFVSSAFVLGCGEAKPAGADRADPSAQGVAAREHAARLRAAPGERGVVGYPPQLVPRVPADRALSTGLKPCVILLYDDASKASDLQAAELLPLLVRRAQDVEVVLIDVRPDARWNEAQKKVLRTHYDFYMPTTVVLAPSRAPVKSWQSHIEAADLERAIDQALQH